MHSHADIIRLQKIKNGTIYLVTATRESGPMWCYLSVPSQKEALFKKALEKGSLDLNQYGQMLFSGDGHTPAEVATDIITEHYT